MDNAIYASLSPSSKDWTGISCSESTTITTGLRNVAMGFRWNEFCIHDEEGSAEKMKKVESVARRPNQIRFF